MALLQQEADNPGSDVAGSSGDEYRAFFVHHRHLKGFDAFYCGTAPFSGHPIYQKINP
jgi:hypothetical protein